MKKHLQKLSFAILLLISAQLKAQTTSTFEEKTSNSCKKVMIPTKISLQRRNQPLCQRECLEIGEIESDVPAGEDKIKRDIHGMLIEKR
jgi:hypothetical protein